jgi:hypothetical protein
VVVCVVDCVEELSRLGQEGSDLTIIPTGDDGLSITGEVDTVAVEAWNLNSEEFLSSLGVPDSNVIQRAGGKEFRVACGEGNVVDLLVVASVSELWVNAVGVAPVDGGLGGSAEEVSRVGSEGDGCNCSHNLSLFLNEHII